MAIRHCLRRPRPAIARVYRVGRRTRRELSETQTGISLMQSLRMCWRCSSGVARRGVWGARGLAGAAAGNAARVGRGIGGCQGPAPGAARSAQHGGLVATLDCLRTSVREDGPKRVQTPLRRGQRASHVPRSKGQQGLRLRARYLEAMPGICCRHRQRWNASGTRHSRRPRSCEAILDSWSHVTTRGPQRAPRRPMRFTGRLGSRTGQGYGIG